MGSLCRAVLVATPAGSSNRGNMVSPKLALALCLLSGSALGARQLRGNRRESRNLLGTFPFNAQEGEHHGAHDDHHGHHEDHARHPVQALEARAQRQGDDTDVSFPAVAAAGPGADGKRRIDKVEMIEEIEYDDVVQCDHSYDRRCHTTYVTQYESQQEEDSKRTSGRTVSLSTSRLPSTRPLRFAGLLLSRIVISRDLRSAGPSTSPSVGPSRRCTMWRTTSSSAPQGPGRFAACPRSK